MPATKPYRLPSYDQSEVLEWLGLVGAKEIAERAGVAVSTVTKWQQRHADFPAPALELAMGKIWRWSDVEPWVDHQKTKPFGRPPSP